MEKMGAGGGGGEQEFKERKWGMGRERGSQITILGETGRRTPWGRGCVLSCLVLWAAPGACFGTRRFELCSQSVSDVTGGWRLKRHRGTPGIHLSPVSCGVSLTVTHRRQFWNKPCWRKTVCVKVGALRRIKIKMISGYDCKPVLHRIFSQLSRYVCKKFEPRCALQLTTALDNGFLSQFNANSSVQPRTHFCSHFVVYIRVTTETQRFDIIPLAISICAI